MARRVDSDNPVCVEVRSVRRCLVVTVVALGLATGLCLSSAGCTARRSAETRPNVRPRSGEGKSRGGNALRKAWFFRPPAVTGGPGVVWGYQERVLLLGDSEVAFPIESGDAGASAIVCLNLATSATRWMRDTGGTVLALASTGNAVVALCEAPLRVPTMHELVILSRHSGDVTGRVALPGATFAHLVAARERAWAVSHDGLTFCADTRHASRLWTWQPPGPLTTGDATIPVDCVPLTTEDGTFYLIAPGQVFRVGMDGQGVWTAPIGPDIGCIPQLSRIAGDRLLVAGDRGIAALSRADGKLLWFRTDIRGIRQTGAMPGDDRYLAATAEQAYALSLASGATEAVWMVPPRATSSRGAPLVAVGPYLLLLLRNDASDDWHLTGVMPDGSSLQVRDPEPFEVGLAMVQDGRILLAFDLHEVRAYDLGPLLRMGGDARTGAP